MHAIMNWLKAFAHLLLLLQCGCQGGGMAPKPPKGFKGKDGNDKHFRVDSYGSTANGAWRGSRLEGCGGVTYYLNTGDVVCPR
jgi:hypothetical protein